MGTVFRCLSVAPRTTNSYIGLSLKRRGTACAACC